MTDCKYRTEDCDNATVCPCLLFIEKTKEEYGKMLRSDLWKNISEEMEQKK